MLFWGFLATILHVMYQLCIFSVAVGHFGCLISHFGTIPCIWCHFPTFRDCFASFVSAEIRFACLHTIFHVISCLYVIASVCVPVCTHFEALHFHLSASYMSVAEALSCEYKPNLHSVCHFMPVCHRLGLRARGHAFRGTSFSSSGSLCEGS